jgi:N utilization substance protein B
MKSRTRARSLALQVLYEVDMTNHPPADVYRQRLEDMPLPDALADFSRAIIYGVLPLVAQIDHVIGRYAPDWPFDQIAAIDRNILRLAAWELVIQRETPVKVVINEAVELAKMFGSDSAPRFVNGVLGTLAERQHEISQSFHSTPQG